MADAVAERPRSTPKVYRHAAIASVVAVSLCVASFGVSALADEFVTTFSIVGYDPATGDVGVAVQSKFFAVGAVVPWAKAGVGAVATQAYGNTTFGPRGLALLEEGLDVESVLDELLKDDAERESRQVGIVDWSGRAAAFTGGECMSWAGHRVGSNFAAQGNILVSEATVEAMAEAFVSATGMLGERLMRALKAGQEAGGDSRGVQSAAIVVVRAGGGYGGHNDRYCDLRVDDHEDPIGELRRLFDMWKGDALILEGYRLCEAGAWDEAMAAGRQAVLMDPNDGEPHYHLACFLSRAGKFAEALQQLETAVGLDGELGARARVDPDFKPLVDNDTFRLITGSDE